jgi:thiol-disulfide isomerase/thioredoxin
LFTTDQLLAHPDNVNLLVEYYLAHAGEVSRLSMSNGIAADKLYKEVEKSLGMLTASEGEFAETLKAIRSNLAELRGEIDKVTPAFQMIGKTAAPVLPEVWINGEAVAPESLKGKVILLDFFAMWCGPCIQAFPDLREWQTKYGADGLEIIGVTTYVGYDWDEQTKSVYSPMNRTVSHDEERKVLGTFAKHHDLKHRLAVMPDQSFNDTYGVNGIPHVVLIDRDGVIRLVQIGVSDESTYEVEQMIRNLLGISAQSADAG